MTETPINLNKARKSRARAAKKQRAKENRAKHGQPGAVRRTEAKRRSAEVKRLNGHRLDED